MATENNVARKVLWLGIASVLAPFLGVINNILRRIFDPVSVNVPNIMLPTGFLGVMLALVLSLWAIVIAVPSLRRGERSWLLWARFIPALLVALFWTLIIIAEILFPH